MLAINSLWKNSQLVAKKLYRSVLGVTERILTPANSGLNSKQLATGLKALKILGIDDETGLTKHDLIIFLYAVGLNPTDDVIDSKLRAFKLHENETFTYGHVCHVWNSMLQDLTDEEEILRRAFQFFDKDGNGEISIPELRTTMHELGDLLSEEEILSFMSVMDVNNDGVIGFQEFIDTLKTQTPELITDNNQEKEGLEAEFSHDAGDSYVPPDHRAIEMGTVNGHGRKAVAESKISSDAREEAQLRED